MIVLIIMVICKNYCLKAFRTFFLICTCVKYFNFFSNFAAIGRNNLLLLTRLVIRGLLENCMQLKCRMLHAEHQQLQDFFIMVDKVLRHGFKGIAVSFVNQWHFTVKSISLLFREK